MTTITIRHTHADGTILEGSSKGDGVYEIVRQHGFTWRPAPGIHIQGSRDQVARRWRINAAANALRAAGHEVTVDIDDTPRDRATVLADQQDRLDGRRERLEASAQRHAAASEAAHNRADQLGERFYMGQPIIVGHHSERGARNAQAKMHDATRRAIDEGKTAAYQAQRAAAVGAQAERSLRPDVTARRIEKAEADLRGIQRDLDGHERRHLNGRGEVVDVERHGPATGGWREQLLARKALLEEQLTYDRKLVADAIAAGTYAEYNAKTIHPGDQVYDGWGWKKVVKPNKVTVSCESGYSWMDKVRYSDIRQVRCAHQPAEPEPQVGPEAAGKELETLPQCPSGHGQMVLRDPPGGYTPEQQWCGIWYDCTAAGCHSSTLYMSAELRAERERAGVS